MARFGLIGIQYSDDSGNPLVNGLLDFFQSGSSDEADRITTYSDPGQKIPNANPVPLSAAGRQPNIFFDGAARVVLRTSAGVQIEVRDPVPSLASSGTAFAAWNALVTYDEDQIVIGSDGNYYLSIGPNNLNHNPISTTGFWQNFGFINTYNAAQTYDLRDIVLATDDNLYLSVVANNLNNEPSVSPTQWKILTSTGSVSNPVGGSTDNAIARFDGATGDLIQNSGVLIDDSDNVTGIANLNMTGTLTGPSGTWSASGINLAAGDSFFIDSNNVLSQTTLGATVLNSSLTNLGVITGFTSTGIDDNATGERLQIADTVIDFGTAGATYTLSHSASDQILGITGGLSLSSGANILLHGATHASQADDMTFRASGVSTLFYDDSLSTWNFQANDVITTGTVITAGISLGDNQKINIGASNDLQLYHDGFGSFISDQGTGSLKILTSDLRVQNTADSQPSFVAVPGSSVILYFAGGAKLSTTTSGVTVTGNLIASGASAAALLDEVASASNPTLVPNRADTNTGIGSESADNLSLIAGGSERVRIGTSTTTVIGNLLISNAAGPALFDEAATSSNPTVLPNRADSGTGIGWVSANVLSMVAGGSSRMTISSSSATVTFGNFQSGNAAGPVFKNAAATSTAPTLAPNQADQDTGIGWASADKGSLIAGGVEVLRFNAIGLADIQMGARVKHADGVQYAIGTQEMPIETVNTTQTINTAARIGGYIQNTSGSPAFTVDQQATIQAGVSWRIDNPGGGSFTLVAGSGVTLELMDGDAVLTGTITVTVGGAIALTKITDTLYRVAGSGASS